MKATMLNGTLYIDEACDDVSLSASDRGFLLGDGLFETLPVLHGAPLWWQEHRARLTQSANRLEMSLDPVMLEHTVSQLAALSSEANAILRIALSRGSGGRGLLPPEEARPTLLATLAPLPDGLAFQDMSLATSIIRRNAQSLTASIKSNNYLDNVAAAQQAEQAGVSDALLLNTEGKIACTTIGNLFSLHGNRLTTPPVSDGVLPGIVRQQLLTLAPQWGFVATEASLSPEDIKKADGLFMTNSLRFIRRVTAWDDHAYTAAPDDPISQLQTHMRDYVAKLTGVTI
ncbi:branched-chain amino acid aminotransferase [Cohaesibacter marisflavi]|uniref:Probable branched-chain-amino-acid aminotransferase n=1 Tax=Cohaesibacter marisflavi TaxID=655353 RepID=A0A1I5FYK3_9HYPH|nr:aminotransferase class IV [Cohaesibacter marisflavi]SFO28830.1 branched-chain amino acid aminotransferase [Cohaesibacter marisflavi]